MFVKVNDYVGGINPIYRLAVCTDKNLWLFEINLHTYVYEITFIAKNLPIDRDTIRLDGLRMSNCGTFLSIAHTDGSLVVYEISITRTMPAALKLASTSKTPRTKKDKKSDSRASSRLDTATPAGDSWAGPASLTAVGVPEHRLRTAQVYNEIHPIVFTIPPKHLSKAQNITPTIAFLALPNERVFGKAREVKTRACVVWYRGSSVISLYSISTTLSSSRAELEASGSKPIRQWPFPAIVTAVALSEDSELLAVGTADGAVTLLQLSSGTPLHLLSAHRGPVTCLTFYQSSRLISGGPSGSMFIYDLSEGVGAQQPELAQHERYSETVFAEGRVLPRLRTPALNGDVINITCLNHAPLLVVLVERPYTEEELKLREGWLLIHSAFDKKPTNMPKIGSRLTSRLNSRQSKKDDEGSEHSHGHKHHDKKNDGRRSQVITPAVGVSDSAYSPAQLGIQPAYSTQLPFAEALRREMHVLDLVSGEILCELKVQKLEGKTTESGGANGSGGSAPASSKLHSKLIWAHNAISPEIHCSPQRISAVVRDEITGDSGFNVFSTEAIITQAYPALAKLASDKPAHARPKFLMEFINIYDHNARKNPSSVDLNHTPSPFGNTSGFTARPDLTKEEVAKHSASGQGLQEPKRSVDVASLVLTRLKERQYGAKERRQRIKRKTEEIRQILASS